MGSDSLLQQKLEQADIARKEAETQIEQAKDRCRRMEERLQLAKQAVGNWMKNKNSEIQKLH